MARTDTERDDPTREEIRSLGWNTIMEEQYMVGNLRQLSQQLTYIGLLLYDIRAAMDEEVK